VPFLEIHRGTIVNVRAETLEVNRTFAHLFKSP
jgi:hypothetical protein